MNFRHVLNSLGAGKILIVKIKRVSQIVMSIRPLEKSRWIKKKWIKTRDIQMRGIAESCENTAVAESPKSPEGQDAGQPWKSVVTGRKTKAR